MKPARFGTLLLLTQLALHGCSNGHTGSLSPHGAASAGTPVIVEELDATDAGGVGWLTSRDERGEGGLIELARVTVDAEQVGDYAAVSIEHHFVSRATTVQEGTFRFPLPEDALLTGLSMVIDGRVVDGELLEREKARRVYEEIVDSMQDPALLEWEHGSTFKMRVFPIEPQQPKLVTIRYLVPLKRKGKQWIFSQGTRQNAGAGQLKELTLRWQGRQLLSERDLKPGKLLEAVAQQPADVLREERPDGAYTAVRVSPNWTQVPLQSRAAPKHWIFVVDTSRSALEERKLQLETLRTLLAAVGPQERFTTLTSDLDVRAEPSGFVTPSAANQASALAFVEARSPDGATHLSALFESLAKLAAPVKDVAVVYIGDCEPTWGVVGVSELRELAARSLGPATFNPIVIGSAVDTALAQDLAQSTRGRWLRAEQPEQLAHFVHRLRTPAVRSANVVVGAAPGATVFPAGQLPLEEGQELVLLVKTPKDQDAVKALTVQTTLQTPAGPQTLDWRPSTPPAPTRFVAERFGSRLIQALERAGAPKEEVVTASLSHRVMSKYTSFLVLESEEAYARYAIERKAKRDAEAPRVTGGDLNSLDANGASISLDRIQPGDPEIYIDAPRDCVSVTVVFPFGETKRARFDPEANQGRGAWMVRFLVDRDTAEGLYEAQVYIVHRDGHRELRKVSYAVDHTAPTLQVQIRPLRRGPAGTFEVQVTQPGPREQRDLRHVEIRTPDGTVQELLPVRWAEFRGTFRLGSPAAAKSALRVVGIDQALNHRTIDVELP